MRAVAIVQLIHFGEGLLRKGSSSRFRNGREAHLIQKHCYPGIKTNVSLWEDARFHGLSRAKGLGKVKVAQFTFRTPRLEQASEPHS